MLSSNPTKAEEIAHYNAFVTGLPRGTYLYSMFHGTQGRVENEIRSDIAIGPLNDVLAERDRLAKELHKMECDKDALVRLVNDLRKSETRLRDSIDDLKAQARRIGQ